ncbi:hypothetical protein LCGC14_2422840, partial [marine sediment metagenome]
LKKDAKAGTPPKSFGMMVKGRTFVERADAGEALAGTIQALPLALDGGALVEVGRYRGFLVKAQNIGGLGYRWAAESLETGRVYSMKSIEKGEMSPVGLIQRLDNRFGGIPVDLEYNERELERSKASQQSYQDLLNKPFEHEERLQATQAEMARLDRVLQGEGIEGGPSDNVQTYEEEELEEQLESYRYGEAAPEQVVEPTVREEAVQAIGEADEVMAAAVVPDQTVGEREESASLLQDVRGKLMGLTADAIEAGDTGAERVLEEATSEVAQVGRVVEPSLEELEAAKVKPVEAAPAAELGPGSEALIRAAKGLGIGDTEIRQAANILARLDGQVVPGIHHVAEAAQYLSPGAGESIIEAARQAPQNINAQSMLQRFKAATTDLVPVEAKPKRKRRVKVPRKPGTVRRRALVKAVKKAPPKRVRPKPEATVPLETLVQAQEERTPRAQTMDSRKRHSKTIRAKNPRAKRWLKRPGSMDIMGIDTPSKRRTRKPRKPSK